MSLQWQWEQASRIEGGYGNPNQFTVGGGMASLAREAGQNSNDARRNGETGELHFTFIPLSGQSRTDFEQAFGWSELRKHLKAMANNGQVFSDILRDGTDYLDTSDELLLLRIEDRGCFGLTGPEFADVDESEFGHFVKLCRLDLFSGKEEAKGGSFGLGKAVYWRFSRLQTVLFGSNLYEPLNGMRLNRVFGVNQGTVHKVDGSRYKGRGHFGERETSGDIRSVFADDATAERLRLGRPAEATGTTALIIGFWDPDHPEHTVDQYRSELESGLEEAFWPLISRGRMRIMVDVESDPAPPVEVRPERSFSELVHAIRSYDQSDESESLQDVGDVVVRDITIRVPRRKTEPQHDPFEHTAKLIVTLSDDQKDTMENKVCLVRGPEMVVDTITEEFPGITYHAVLLAGLAVDPNHVDERTRRADGFLRIAEPPSHDKWIPTGRGAPQTSLAANYVAPFIPNLRDIQTAIKQELRDLFGVVLKGDDRPPQSIVRYLRVLRGPGVAPRVGKPQIDIDEATVTKGCWQITATATMKNRPEGWAFRPEVRFVGVEGGEKVKWSSVDAVQGCSVVGGWAYVPGRDTGRTLRAVFTGSTDPDSHPIPADRSAIEVLAAEPGPNPEAAP